MPDPVTCVACGREGPVELQMTVKSGQVLTMVSCPKCESRSWYADGTPVSKEEVLKITANDPEFVVVPSPSKARARPRR
jgi:DNA-directed RNA polymerase subunit RPC12/RpoP